VWVVLVLFIASIYLRGIGPTIHFQDSAEFCAVASCLGNSHPPGYPLWTLLANAMMRWIPLGEEAFRANLASALPMTLAGLLLGVACGRTANRGRALAVSMGCVAGALGERAWFVAGVAEVHGLGVLLFCAGLLHVLREEGKAHCWMGLSFLTGLAWVNHQSSALLFLVLFLWSGARCRAGCLVPRRLVRAGAVGLIGLAGYLVLALAASRNPPANWGDPSNWSNLAAHVLRRQYGEVPPLPSSLDVYLLQVEAYAKDVLAQLPLPVVGLAFVGIFYLRRPKAWLILTLLCVSTLVFLYLSGFEVAEWRPPIARLFYVPSFFLASLLGAVGFARIASGRRMLLSAGSLFLMLPWIVLSSWAWNQRREDDLARRYGMACIREMPRRGVLFTAGDNAIFTSRYLRTVEGVQEGLILVSRIGLVAPGFRASLRKEHPRWDLPSEGEVELLQTQEQGEEGLHLSTGRRDSPTWLSPLCVRVVEGLPKELAVGWELGGEDEELRDRLDSVGFISLVRRSPGRSPQGPALQRRAGDYVEEVSRLGARFYLNRDATFAYATKFNEAGVLEARRGFPHDALPLYETALFLNPRQASALANLAMTKKELDPKKDILPLLEQAVCQNPLNLTLLWVQCSQLAGQERFQEAKKGYERMLRLSPRLVGPLIALYDLSNRSDEGASWKKGIHDRLLVRVREDENAAILASKWALQEEEWALLDACAQAWPFDPVLRRRQVQALSRQEAPEKAMGILQRHLQQFPSDGKAWHSLGDLFRDQGLLSQAERAYEKAYSLGITGAARNLSLCLIDEGKLGDAEHWLLSALEADSRDTEAWVSLAAVWGQQGRLEEAEEACRRALEVEPQHKKAYLNWALIQAAGGSLQEAVSILEKAVQEVRPEDRAELERDLQQYKDLIALDGSRVMIE